MITSEKSALKIILGGLLAISRERGKSINEYNTGKPSSEHGIQQAREAQGDTCT